MSLPKTKDKILLAALDLFSEMGFDSASIDLIAAKVGIKGPSIYAHFKSKEDIFDSLIDLMEQRYEENFGNTCNLRKLPDSLAEFKEYCLERICFTMTDSQIQKVRKLCVKEQFRNAKIAALTSKHQFTGNQKMYGLVLEDMMKKGLIKNEDINIMSLELISPITLIVAIVDREPEKIIEMQNLVKDCIDHFIKIYGVIKDID